MNVKSVFATLAICSAAIIGTAQSAKADSFSVGYQSGWHGNNHSRYSVELGAGPGYRTGGYYAPRYCYTPYGRPYYCNGQPYGYSGYYGPGIGISYYGGYRGGWYGWNGNGRWHDRGGWGGGGRGWDHGGSGHGAPGWNQGGWPGRQHGPGGNGQGGHGPGGNGQGGNGQGGNGQGGNGQGGNGQGGNGGHGGGNWHQ